MRIPDLSTFGETPRIENLGAGIFSAGKFRNRKTLALEGSGAGKPFAPKGFGVFSAKVEFSVFAHARIFQNKV